VEILLAGVSRDVGYDGMRVEMVMDIP
jgi:hypothetical protein